ncbi:hypothetical protein GCM10009623_34370 [Nocardioides aestuarii]|uniref:DUF4239 domain-containing protein n=1 Tax=Nocardioides aestuarii TaxID=252231 RepID=A0ABW4TS55_9ACTN
MTDTDGGAAAGDRGSGNPDNVQAAATVAGVDVYAFRARVLPAILATAPLIALGVLALPFLEGAQRWWSVTSLAVPAFATLLARRAGNRVQGKLYSGWDGAPTTRRLRYSSDSSPEEIDRRHERIRALLGDVTLPDQAEETAHPEASDRRYADAVNRLRPLVRNHPELGMLNLENRNYGFARNLFGLKGLGVAGAWAGLAASITIAVLMWLVRHDPAAATIAALPAGVSLVTILAWRTVDEDYVRPSAEAYADRLVEALDILPARQS